MKTFLISACSSLFFSFNSFGILTYQNTVSAALSNSSVACSFEFSVPENTSAFKGENFLISFSASNKYFIKELSPVHVRAINPITKNSALVAGLGRIGSNLFSENYFAFGIAHKLGKKISAGINLQYSTVQLKESRYNDYQSIIPEITLYSNPLPYISFGAIIRNPVKFRMDDKDALSTPAEINSGISIRVSDKINLALSVIQQNDLPLSVHAGMEYNIMSKLFIRCGAQARPVSQSFGAGFHFRKWVIDVAFTTEPLTGQSSSASLTFLL